MSHCGVVPTAATLSFFYDDLSIVPSFGVPVNCAASTVSFANQYNSVWWATPGNGVNVNGQLKCAQLAGSGSVVVSTIVVTICIK